MTVFYGGLERYFLSLRGLEEHFLRQVDFFFEIFELDDFFGHICLKDYQMSSSV